MLRLTDREDTGSRRLPFEIDTVEVFQPEVSFPDVDSDFGTNLVTGENKDAIFRHLQEKYGEDYVIPVGTVNRFAGKSLIQALARVNNIDLEQSRACSKEYQNTLDLQKNCEQSASVRSFFSMYPALREKVESIQGAISAYGQHAGGVVIADKERGYNLARLIPFHRSNDDKHITTACTKKQVEKLGLIKYDLLALITATIMHRAKEIIGYPPARNYYEDGEDQMVFAHIAKHGKHKKIFQFDTALGKKALCELQPQNIQELAVVSGLIRFMGNDEGRAIYDTYRANVIAARTGKGLSWEMRLREQIIEDANYTVARQALAESYGVLVYQEQIAYLVRGLSGGQKTFTDGNIVRKKLNDLKSINTCQGKEKEIREWHAKFMGIMNEYVLPYIGRDGWRSESKEIQNFLACKLDENNRLITPKSGIVSWFIAACSYLFSKLHAIAYSVNTYDLMYLKYYHPAAFWSATIDAAEGDHNEVQEIIQSMKSENTEIDILAPDINTSEAQFAVEGSAIRYGLGSISKCGSAALSIIEERRKNGAFVDIADFCQRIPKKIVNKRALTHLVYSNAFADFGDIQCVIDLLSREKRPLDPITADIQTLRIKEEEALGINISFMHPLLKQAHLYTSIPDIPNGQIRFTIVKVIRAERRFTRNYRPYILVECQCQRSYQNQVIFDFSNGTMIRWFPGFIGVIQVERDGDMYRIPNSYKWRVA